MMDMALSFPHCHHCPLVPFFFSSCDEAPSFSLHTCCCSSFHLHLLAAVRLTTAMAECFLTREERGGGTLPSQALQGLLAPICIFFHRWPGMLAPGRRLAAMYLFCQWWTTATRMLKGDWRALVCCNRCSDLLEPASRIVGNFERVNEGGAATGDQICY